MIKVGDKVVCIKESHGISIGNIYDVHKVDGLVHVLNDDTNIDGYYHERFKVVKMPNNSCVTTEIVISAKQKVIPGDLGDGFKINATCDGLILESSKQIQNAITFRQLARQLNEIADVLDSEGTERVSEAKESAQ